MRLRRLNNLLSLLIIALGLYISFSPFLPEIAYRLRDKSADASAPYSGELAKEEGSSSTAPTPSDNRIVIPSIQLNEPIFEGGGIGVIRDGGTWRRPGTSEPTKIGNTVIIGHRFYGNNISTFYHFDKVLVGQKLAIYWEGKELLYEVAETKVVETTAVEIEAPTSDRRLTLYTCTPIWTAKQRLVVVAKPVNALDNNK